MDAKWLIAEDQSHARPLRRELPDRTSKMREVRKPFRRTWLYLYGIREMPTGFLPPAHQARQAHHLLQEVFYCLKFTLSQYSSFLLKGCNESLCCIVRN